MLVSILPAYIDLLNQCLPKKRAEEKKKAPIAVCCPYRVYPVDTAINLPAHRHGSRLVRVNAVPRRGGRLLLPYAKIIDVHKHAACHSWQTDAPVAGARCWRPRWWTRGVVSIMTAGMAGVCRRFVLPW